MIIERTFQGAWRISDMIDGRRISRVYFVYSLAKAIKLFIEERKGILHEPE